MAAEPTFKMPVCRTHRKYFTPPIQLVKHPDGVVVKRGGVGIKITGLGAAQALKLIFSITCKRGASLRELSNLFASSSRSHVRELLGNLIDRHLLIPIDRHDSTNMNQESHLDGFLWHFGQTADQVLGRLNSARMAIIGVNHISRQLATTLSLFNQSRFDVIDHPEHRNRVFFDQTGQLKKTEWPAWLKPPLEWQEDFESQLHGCVVATSDFDRQAAFLRWNSFCVDNKLLFVPLLLKSMIGHLGPFIVPGETACYQCLVSRQGSHAGNSDIDTITDYGVFQSQQMSGFHPSMATILGELAAFELMRMYSDTIPGRKAGRLLEVDLLASRITERAVLKVPRCTACSPLRGTTPTDLCKAFFP